ncbi:Long-chain-fatty-acid--CoA ligase [Achromobacter denitrificans]|uniref:Long-chain-fatty-acid--CoA ligase n=1 Tax=Achromobacter denitrificans TaxID=32002 RepID=A0ABZ3GF44_ACHDE|nr:AMP-binding protein [Achromobacter denitrificans]OLU01217.1 long-chain fatty acid--CoA ligase [Achromobacter denitrificans]QCS64876.1 long-chain fatty acid--CoA ligase [Achromobacter denitrificans]QKH42303.1 AMP-binding protein [Achromobacter denitrificans]QKH50555.1 AMP-binding protein [Achromobacter denitrificans]CAB3733259.1 Long-chain-fatty-acid--CoA ligase [Achromobacter denitrificans]
MERIWQKSYPPGVPAEIEMDGVTTLVSVVRDSCRRYADKTAYISMGKSIRYAELDRLTRDFAAWLHANGLGHGDRVALMMPNLLQYPVCLFGALRAGCVVVNCNPLYTAHELQHQLADSGARAIVVADNFAATLQNALAGTAVERVVVTSIGELLGPVKGRLVDFVVRRVKRLVPAWSLPRSIRLRDALRAGRAAPFAEVDLDQRDLACLQYTGGTTGVAKAAMLTHGNLVANLSQAYAWVRPLVTEGRECIVTALPLYHIFALTANCLTFMKMGASNLLILNPRDIPGLIKEMRKVPFSAFTGVNTLFNALLNHPDFARLDFSRLRLTMGGGMAVQRSVADRWQAVTGRSLAQAYGLTETSPAVTINPLDVKVFTGSIGLPVPSTELSIRDDEGRELGVGESGEICVRGPQVTQGYWKRPDETALVLYADGFLRTGDIGYVDENGYVFLVDRKKDMILVSGFNVYPNEVEDVAALHPGVKEVAAVGVPDERSGEAVKLYVIRKDPGLDAETLIAHCRKQLTGYKVPRYVEFRDDLPRTNVGKILRRELKPAAPPAEPARSPARP